MTSFYVTSPIYYLNDVPHLGHAYTTLACDILARFYRLGGHHVAFATGTDEHGQKIARAAQNAGKSEQVYVDELASVFKNLANTLGTSYTDFIRTSEDRHKKAAQALWVQLQEAGYIYKGTYEGWYAVRDEAYYDASEIVDGKAPTGAPVEWVQEPCYFFKLSAFQEPLLDFYRNNPSFVGPRSRMNEIIRFVESGLNDLSISRSTFTWGIPVPGEEGHVMYVWIEALTNYLTVLGYPNLTEEAKNFWSESLHVVGKDILRFHAVYWPAFLMAAGLTPPKRVYAHGWWTNEGEKMSKSLGNVIDPFGLIEKYGLDPLRYFLFREVPFGQDGNFSHRAMIQRLNAELANDLGNLAQRVLAFISKNRGGVIPTPGTFLSQDQEVLEDLLPALHEDMKEQLLSRYLDKVWERISLLNRYVDKEQPWALRKSDKPEDQARLDTVLYVLLSALRSIAYYVMPFMPTSGEKLLGYLGQEVKNFNALKMPIEPGIPLPPPSALFPRWEDQ